MSRFLPTTHANRRFAIPLACAAAMLGATTIAAVPAAAEPSPPCPEVEVVFARGTWEPPGVGVTGQAFIDALNAQRGGPPVAVYAINYPATLDFPAATAGIGDASTHIEQTAASCPGTKVVLGGYSQGAAVAAYTTTETLPPGYVLPPGIAGPMPPAVASHVAAVVLFGTPDPWFLNLVDHAAPPIVVGDLYTAKTIQLCAQGDPVCFPGGLDRAAHSSYATNGMAGQAASFVANALGPVVGGPTTRS